ncbi:glycerol-3-phosphate cytidiltransferase [Pseudothermotoga hypogea DSM 11164 = NBRC 106472]|uniref:Glycerol-3-phosphate cytidiltransferase n=1 Tax=Pseudothermotoga hypogea DSM 11164 = NBRC 106472 TaxID=1123384 RepID=A0A0X1KSG3_9THEM|nr:adenylyltransferase/cytidyltransferase family protein [Pseudothermotoga hypogea]AJC74259.1 glycerol-3-phosphate cytidiltransferase [Pseudothermotoga hypogea DSM 11164 = NBRC 106472]
MRRVLTYGSFDLFHVGHLNFLQRAKTYGDYLIVGVATEAFNLQKGKISLFSYEERAKIVENIKCVDEVFPANSWEEKVKDIERYKPDVIVASEEWKEKYEPLKKLCGVEFLPRMANISSSKFQQLLTSIDELCSILRQLPDDDRRIVLNLIREKLRDEK